MCIPNLARYLCLTWRVLVPAACCGCRSCSSLASLAQVEREVADYARQVLDAMGIENGPGHMEVMMTVVMVMVVVVMLR